MISGADNQRRRVYPTVAARATAKTSRRTIRRLPWWRIRSPVSIRVAWSISAATS